ncbi:MAG: ABC transporter permease [Verrucomicrobiae bacterium]|nr:ABC transporter permease [Verrucomicrobiae bacterium]
MRASLLMGASFVLPLLLWSIAAYGPFWSNSKEITIASDTDDKDGFAGAIAPGDVFEADRFSAYQDAVRNDNKALEAAQSTPEPGQSRANMKVLRSIFPVAKEEGWLTQDQEKDYDALFDVWGRIAENEKGAASAISDENLPIVQQNWARLSKASTSYDEAAFVDDVPLLRLVPEAIDKKGRPVFLPAPHEVLSTAIRDFSGNSKLGDLMLGERYIDSIRTIVSGFVIACLIGVPIALLCGTFSFFSRLIEPFVDFFRYMPAPAFGTLLVALFGIQSAPKVALVVIGTLPQMILMVANTTRMIDGALLDAAQTLGAKRPQLVSKVVIPGILPMLYNDLRILLGWAWTWLVIAELIGTKVGLTELIDTHGRRFHFDHVYPWILLIGLTGFVTDQVLSNLRSILFPWVPEAGHSRVRHVLERVGNWLRPGQHKSSQAAAILAKPKEETST